MSNSGLPIESSLLDRELSAYNEWKRVLIKTMDDYQAWSRRHRLNSKESEQRIAACRNAIDSDQLTIAFVAEFSRGKTELINAIFFADYGRRLLPSTAGRTTMCPTELFYDQAARQPAYIRLLPIETRLQGASLAELKKNPGSWVTYPLDPSSADQVAGCLQQVVQTRHVGLEEAKCLGLYRPEQTPRRKNRSATIEIPKWRHALISFPHPLLKQGLTILDTPGLNSLGSEPELTLNMLPSAQAVLFVLAADAGVTRSDMEMWQNHIRGYKRDRRQGLMVVLNKVDVLWDELQDDPAIAASIEKQCNDTARTLSIPRRNIFPVSAQKGLLCKVKGDRTLLQKSGLPKLENYLSHEVLATRKEIIRDTITAEVSHMLENSIGIVAGRHKGILAQLSELQGLNGKSGTVIEHLIRETRREQSTYMQDISSFQTSRQLLQKQARRLRQALDLKRLEQRIDLAEQRMHENWTTLGLKNNMRTLFNVMRGNMQLVVDESEQARTLIRSIYQRFQSDQRFSVIQPKMFSMMRFRVELEMLHHEAEVFRNSPVTAMTEKRFVIQRFFMTIVSRARMLFTTAHGELDSWMKTALEPLIFQIREHREQMQSRLENLKKISSSRDTLEARIAELQQQEEVTQQHLSALLNMYSTLNEPHEPAEKERPRLAARRSASG